MTDFDAEQLIKQIKELKAELKTAKKYGLVWDKETNKEEVVLQCEQYIPILIQDAKKKITNGKDNCVLIEGDNFHSLTSLAYIKEKTIDVIYIDPPYNTGNNDFIYNDKYVGEDDGYRHSKWLSMMQKRLELARKLLSSDGVMFISIDENEQANLRLLCNSIFGERNVETVIWAKEAEANSGKMKRTKHFRDVHEYLIVCYMDREIQFNRINQAMEVQRLQTTNLAKNNQNKRGQEDRIFTITNPENGMSWTDEWKYSKEEVERLQAEGLLYFGADGTNKPRQILPTDDRREVYVESLVTQGSSTAGRKNLEDILGPGKFDNPKPVKLIKTLVKIASKKDSVVLDFFAGSGTTGQAVLELNKEDGGHRRFILCTNNENNICLDVTYPRLKTVITGKRQDGTKYSDGLNANLYYFKTDFIKDEANTEQAKYNLVEKVDALLCVAENIYEEKERNDYSSHFVSDNKHLFIYNDYYNSQKFEEFKKRVLSANGEKIVYVYSSDNNVDETLIENADVVIKPIPSKIYEIYKEIVEDIKRGE